jgi:NosR/NirI family nitrous oxide reductase transcriptional regulator
MTESKPIVRRSRLERRIQIERGLAILAFLTILMAWFVGGVLQNTDIEPALVDALPDADRFEPVAGETYAAYQGDALIGYISIGEAVGYGGPLKVAAAVEPAGNIIGISIASHKETPSFMERVLRTDFMAQFLGKSYADSYLLDEDVDNVTGATYTARAIADSTLQASRAVASHQLGLEVPEIPPPPIKFGIPEITLIALYAAGYIGHRRSFKYKKQLRWALLITGMLVLGFWFNLPLTISRINSFLMGYWPQWQTNIYWYLLVGGLFLIFTVDNKNAYCAWFCPFGAAQECMGAIGGAKSTGPRLYRRNFVWIQRGLAWLAVVLAFLFRNPGISSYEIFGTLFEFTGSMVAFALLGIVLVLSLFIRRPWCNFLCPLDPVFDLIRLVRTWILELWQTIKNKINALSTTS